MTIILAIPTKNGLVLASDGQITAGAIRTYGKKIKELKQDCLWGASGRESLIQRVEEEISKLPKEKSLTGLRDDLARGIKKCIQDLYELDHQPPEEDFVFAEYRNNISTILHITMSGTPELIRTGPFGIGIGRVFVHALLQKYQKLIPKGIDIIQGSLLAFKVIEEAIEVGGYGIGPPIDVWQVSGAGVNNLNEEELNNLKNSCGKLRELEIKKFLEGIYDDRSTSENKNSGGNLAK